MWDEIRAAIVPTDRAAVLSPSISALKQRYHPSGALRSDELPNDVTNVFYDRDGGYAFERIVCDETTEASSAAKGAGTERSAMTGFFSSTGACRFAVLPPTRACIVRRP
jgi:hypothetical protein